MLCLLGAAWVQRDYFNRILSFKRRFGTRFVMMVHDLIPIYARETCDQGTARVFEEFLRRALRHVDHYLSVSENTAKDLRRYCSSLSLPEPRITVTRNGSSFDEFLPNGGQAGAIGPEDMPDRFVLFVATIEGRKNHQLMLDIWRRMVADGDDPPHLVCVGRVGWKSQSFIAEMVETNYLNGRIVLLQDVSDAHLKLLYSRCLFTVSPSLYEGWGLPIGESLAAGKICVCSDRASLPEVAGEFGVYIDIDDPEQSWRVIRDLISDAAMRRAQEAKIRAELPADHVALGRGTDRHRLQDDSRFRVAGPVSLRGHPLFIGDQLRLAGARCGRDIRRRPVDPHRGHKAGPFPGRAAAGAEFPERRGRAGGWRLGRARAVGHLAMPSRRRCRARPGAERKPTLLRVPPPARQRAGLRRGDPFLANGEIVWDGRLGPRPRDIMMRVRRRAAGAGGWWRLRIRAEADLSDEMRAHIAAIDSRVPTIGFERLVVVPENDLRARLDVMSNLLL